MMEDADVALKGINAGSATRDYTAYQTSTTPSTARPSRLSRLTVDFLVLHGKKILTSRCRDPKEVGRGALGADYVCESTGVFLHEAPPPRPFSMAVPRNVDPLRPCEG
jgi:glyceraldehyde 3-phosphate dehydrogenase